MLKKESIGIAKFQHILFQGCLCMKAHLMNGDRKGWGRGELLKVTFQHLPRILTDFVEIEIRIESNTLFDTVKLITQKQIAVSKIKKKAGRGGGCMTMGNGWGKIAKKKLTSSSLNE